MIQPPTPQDSFTQKAPTKRKREDSEAELQRWMADEKNLPPIVDLSKLEAKPLKQDVFQPHAETNDLTLPQYQETLTLLEAEERYLAYRNKTLEPLLDGIHNVDVRNTLRTYVYESPLLFLQTLITPEQLAENFKEKCKSLNEQHRRDKKIAPERLEAAHNARVKREQDKMAELRQQGCLPYYL